MGSLPGKVVVGGKLHCLLGPRLCDLHGFIDGFGDYLGRRRWRQAAGGGAPVVGAGAEPAAADGSTGGGEEGGSAGGTRGR